VSQHESQSQALTLVTTQGVIFFILFTILLAPLFPSFAISGQCNQFGIEGLGYNLFILIWRFLVFYFAFIKMNQVFITTKRA